ncbi:MAG: ATP-binding protein [Flavobacteriaceae bacterium]|nr:ATP-binding protein [Flavobacteriaceae bacterium]
MKRDTLGVVSNLRQIAIIQFNMGSYYDCESTAIEALKLLETLKEDESINDSKIGLYNQLGRVYRVLHDYDVALDNYQKAEKIEKSKKNLNIIQNNIAVVYKELGKFDLAETKFKEIYENSQTVNDSVQLARAMDNLGFIKSKLNKPEGIDLMTKALALRIKINDLQGVYASYKHLTEYYTDRNDKIKAKLYANKAFLAAKKINSISFIEDALSNLVELDEDPNIIRYKKLKDSMADARQRQDNKYALIKYNYFEQEKLVKENEIQKEKEKRAKQFSQGVVVFLLLSVFFTYFILKTRNRKEKIQQVYDTETRISKKVHDEVANDVYHVMAKLQTDAVDRNAIIDELENIYVKTRDISKENAQIDFEEDFEETLADLISSYRSEKVNIITKQLSEVKWSSVIFLKKQVIYRVLQELLTNMKKHSEATVVVLSFEKKGKKISVLYSDNGRGCHLKKGIGLQNTENRILSVKGTLNFETEIGQGFKAFITF